MIVSLAPATFRLAALDRYDALLAENVRADGGSLRRALVSTTEDHLDGLAAGPLARALDGGSTAEAGAALAWDELEVLLEGPFFEAFWSTFAASAEAEAERLGFVVQRQRVRRATRAALSWAAEAAGKAPRFLGRDRGAAIMAVLRRAAARGMSGRLAASLLLRGRLVALDERGVRAVMRFLGGQADSGVAIDVAFRRSEAYARRLLRQRALTIARTEINRAQHAGLQEAWRQGRRRGLIPDSALVEWRVRPRACPICADLDGERVPVGSAFSNGLYHPPVHPNCQCTLALIRAPRRRRRKGEVGLTWEAA